MTLIRGSLVVLALGTSAAAAPGDDPRDTHRISVGASAMVFASFPLSIEDPGPALVVGRPLWLGVRRRFFQWSLGATAIAGWGTESSHGHVAAALQGGFSLYLGPVFGFELAFGPVAVAQVGHRSVAGLGILSSGGYVFRFWDDDRRRLKLMITMVGAGYLASDPGNDLGTNAGAFGIGLAYETPW